MKSHTVKKDLRQAAILTIKSKMFEILYNEI